MARRKASIAFAAAARSIVRPSNLAVHPLTMMRLFRLSLRQSADVCADLREKTG
jgi:hypothetical protein